MASLTAVHLNRNITALTALANWIPPEHRWACAFAGPGMGAAEMHEYVHLVALFLEVATGTCLLGRVQKNNLPSAKYAFNCFAFLKETNQFVIIDTPCKPCRTKWCPHTSPKLGWPIGLTHLVHIRWEDDRLSSRQAMSECLSVIASWVLSMDSSASNNRLAKLANGQWNL